LENIEFSISSRKSKFDSFLLNYLSDKFGIRAQIIGMGSGNYGIQYAFNGALIHYTIMINGENLHIEISIPLNCNEYAEDHVNCIADEIRKEFVSAEIPIGFANIISEEDYVKIMQDRWLESVKTQKAGAWLSTIILLGSILEGLLLYKIKANPEKANRSKFVPNKDGKPKEYKDWTLEEMINVCHERGWINKDVKSFSNGVKEYRNFVHPWKQFENKLDMPIKKSCELSRSILEIVLDELWKN
jgi:hypothetical protein